MWGLAGARKPLGSVFTWPRAPELLSGQEKQPLQLPPSLSFLGPHTPGFYCLTSGTSRSFQQLLEATVLTAHTHVHSPFLLLGSVCPCCLLRELSPTLPPGPLPRPTWPCPLCLPHSPPTQVPLTHLVASVPGICVLMSPSSVSGTDASAQCVSCQPVRPHFCVDVLQALLP